MLYQQSLHRLLFHIISNKNLPIWLQDSYNLLKHINSICVILLTPPPKKNIFDSCHVDIHQHLCFFLCGFRCFHQLYFVICHSVSQSDLWIGHIPKVQGKNFEDNDDVLLVLIASAELPFCHVHSKLDFNSLSLLLSPARNDVPPFLPSDYQAFFSSCMMTQFRRPHFSEPFLKCSRSLNSLHSIGQSRTPRTCAHGITSVLSSL